MISSFPSSIISSLKYYVYIYSHPDTNEVFYVGKGKGNRVFAHLDDHSESEKASIIRALRTHGKEPKIEILIHGLDREESALKVEAAVIDLLGRDNITNVQKGYRSSTYGRLNIRQIISLYQRSPVEVSHKGIAIRINKQYYPTISAAELYDVTRSCWRIKLNRAQNAEYAFAVYDGIIYEVYQILAWYPGGYTFNSRLSNLDPTRKEFIGNIAPDAIRAQYLYKSISHYFKRGNANPVFYFHI